MTDGFSEEAEWAVNRGTRNIEFQISASGRDLTNVSIDRDEASKAKDGFSVDLDTSTALRHLISARMQEARDLPFSDERIQERYRGFCKGAEDAVSKIAPQFQGEGEAEEKASRYLMRLYMQAFNHCVFQAATGTMKNGIPILSEDLKLRTEARGFANFPDPGDDVTIKGLVSKVIALGYMTAMGKMLGIPEVKLTSTQFPNWQEITNIRVPHDLISPEEETKLQEVAFKG